VFVVVGEDNNMIRIWPVCDCGIVSSSPSINACCVGVLTASINRPKKSLGQHFLNSTDYARAVANAINQDTKNVVEIGPGRGMLTQYLLGRFERLLLIEKDALLAHELEERWGSEPGITVREADFLDFNLNEFWRDSDYSLVGNFPYNISSQIVFRALEHREHVKEVIGMFQLEMAQRIVASPGTKDYGILSVLTATAYEGRLLFRVPTGAFTPPPKVTSAVIRLRRKSNYQLPCSFGALRIVVRSAFGMRRKMLRNSLKGLLPEQTLLHDPLFERRPERLSMEEFVDLALQYEAFQKQP
jgi:16S rRNA (adenine1518-N6/adenine1519-N6)-dimethyltransferase